MNFCLSLKHESVLLGTNLFVHQNDVSMKVGKNCYCVNIDHNITLGQPLFPIIGITSCSSYIIDNTAVEAVADNSVEHKLLFLVRSRRFNGQECIAGGPGCC